MENDLALSAIQICKQHYRSCAQINFDFDLRQDSHATGVALRLRRNGCSVTLASQGDNCLSRGNNRGRLRFVVLPKFNAIAKCKRAGSSSISRSNKYVSISYGG
ncbi:hypothetical protein VFPPC_18176 [Pochonia chlamydosporia 170]|uniref:Uncharacterized protein n=1 Tax=Pochonia chlamydosporia 170 TaxID=1380566 RepID=A0A219AS75_METCM|nr:hypothetical protein VFPPC_18176 [Pochonia chlamydosporia 170]OWT43621.1 hypothetical protein VFPPC_18176 [Pochonia chlamydosporia 170]